MNLHLSDLLERFLTDDESVIDLGNGLTVTRPGAKYYLVFTEGDVEVARYQSGMVHEGLALFTLEGAAIERLLADNSIQRPEGAATHDNYSCAPELCSAHLHTGYAFETLRPMAVFYKQFRVRDRDWVLTAPADDAWPHLMYSFGFESVN